ncbi:hypothetical protein PHLGIDRAFT_18721 [Phlebiopsis gigantea 11061_1 CR5-6]|uniref:Uncharacterized protein n=1 Tax=Phlebiopsis gigantea (strain 11061_1 CR5-6) TaxID=745531 RepID=A0A0C3NUR3_PHLG1|nr:hypothetical protein PHLGIDRAFT_18721 [Phlebiopsis gigantea 11061_1 CR5-6]
MNINSDNIVLVAPRPVRLAAPAPFAQYHHSAATILRPQAINTVRFLSPSADAFERLKLSDESADEDTKSESSERDRSVSPRASPRSTLPSEAVEEFLSILRPSTFLFPPNSPILRPSNGTSHTFFPYRRPGSCNLSPAISSEGLGITFMDQNDSMSKDGDSVTYPFKIIGATHLSSPVSRAHTRNPFPRQLAYEHPVTAFIRDHSASPSPGALALTPSAIPLPLPTPDEMELEPVS